MAQILLFGKLAESAGWRRQALALPPAVATLAGLRAHLAKTHPDIAAPTIRAAINQKLAGPNDPITDEDEIAFMPPMSGG